MDGTSISPKTKRDKVAVAEAADVPNDLHMVGHPETFSVKPDWVVDSKLGVTAHNGTSVVEARITGCLDRFRACLRVAPDSKIGWLLSNTYSEHDIARRSWRGIDDRLIEALQRDLKLSCEFEPVVVRHYQQSGGDYDSEGFADICRFREQDILALSQTVDRRSSDIGQLTMSSQQPSKSSAASASKDKEGTAFFVGADRWRTLHLDEQPYVEYTGNCSQPKITSNFYFAVAGMVKAGMVKVPATPKKASASSSSSSS